MEKNKVIWMIGMFLAGVIIGGAIVCMAYCKCGDRCKPTCNDTTQATQVVPGIHRPVPPLIPLDSAKAYFKCYMKSPKKIDKLVAINVSLDQFVAMQTLLANDSTTAGFRIYMGVVGDPTPIAMVLATETDGSDNESVIYQTSQSDPCPFACDDKSLITE
jgi:hypothetical protein